MSWWVLDALKYQGPVYLFSWCFWLIFSIVLHELGHGIAAVWQGDQTPIKAGHMNMNPLVHMGPQSLFIFAVVGIAWGAMPVNPQRFRMGHLGDVLVSLAGPVVNLLLAILAGTLFGLLLYFGTPSANFTDNFGTFLWVGSMLNLVLFMFNLVPIPPLDGSHILAGLSASAERFYAKPEVQRFAIIAFILLFLTSGDLLYSTASDVTNWWAGTIVTLLS